MRDGYKKIFWGTIIATFSINLGIVQILPPFVGWMVVASGISMLEEDSESIEYDRPKLISYILIGATLVGSIITLFQSGQINPPVPLLFYPMIVMIVELSLFHRIFEAAVRDFTALDKRDLAELYTGKDRAFIMLSGASIILVTVSIFLNLVTVAFFAGIFALIARVYLLTAIRSLGKEDWEDSDEMEEKDYDPEHTLV